MKKLKKNIFLWKISVNFQDKFKEIGGKLQGKYDVIFRKFQENINELLR